MKQDSGGTSFKRFAIGFAIAYVVLQIVGATLYSPSCWGFNLLYFVPLSWLTLFVLCGAGAIYLFYLGKLDGIAAMGAGWMEGQPIQFLVTVSSIYCTLALILRVQIPLLGDSFLVVDNYLEALIGHIQLYMVREPGSLIYFFMLGKIAGTSTYGGLQYTFLVGEMFLGVGMIILNYFIAREALQSPLERFLLFLFLALLPSMQLFFGYIESYAVEAFCLNLFTLVAFVYWNNRGSFLWVCATYCLLIASHSLMLILMPALAYMGYREWRARGIQQIAMGVALLAVFATVVYLLVGGKMETIFPAEQYTHYLSLFNVNDGFQPYTLFSPSHFFDLFNQIMLVAPFGFFLVAGVLRERRWDVFREPPLLFLTISSVLILGFFFGAKFDLGQAADWDVTAPGFIIIQLTLALLLFRTWNRRAQAVFPLVGVLMLLHTGMWVGLNSTREPAIQRFKSLGESGILAPYAYQFNIAHLAAYYLREKDKAAAIDLWRTYSVQYPDSAVGYTNIIALCSTSAEDKGELMDSSYQKWLSRVPHDRSLLPRYINFCLVEGTRKLQRREQAQAHYYFRQAMTYDSTCIPAYPILARLTAEQGDTVEAIRLLERSIRINPRFLEGYIWLGRLYSLTRNENKATQAWNMTLSCDSSYAAGYMELASSYRRIRRNDQATRVLALSRNRDRNKRVLR